MKQSVYRSTQAVRVGFNEELPNQKSHLTVPLVSLIVGYFCRCTALNCTTSTSTGTAMGPVCAKLISVPPRMFAKSLIFSALGSVYQLTTVSGIRYEKTSSS